MAEEKGTSQFQKPSPRSGRSQPIGNMAKRVVGEKQATERSDLENRRVEQEAENHLAEILGGGYAGRLNLGCISQATYQSMKEKQMAGTLTNQDVQAMWEEAVNAAPN